MIPTPGLRCLLEPMRFDKTAEDSVADYVYWALMFRKDSDPKDKEGLGVSADDAAAFTKRRTSDWHPSFRCLFDKANEGQTSPYRVVTARPPILPWKAADTRVTLLGDAIHPMSPTAALGATTALRDTGVLVKLFQQHGISSIVEDLRRYEAEMRKYASEAIEKAAPGEKAMFGMRPYDELPLVESHA